MVCCLGPIFNVPHIREPREALASRTPRRIRRRGRLEPQIDPGPCPKMARAAGQEDHRRFHQTSRQQGLKACLQCARVSWVEYISIYATWAHPQRKSSGAVAAPLGATVNGGCATGATTKTPVATATGVIGLCMARPERFELPTTKFVAWCSIQLSYGRMGKLCSEPQIIRCRGNCVNG